MRCVVCRHTPTQDVTVEMNMRFRVAWWPSICAAWDSWRLRRRGLIFGFFVVLALALIIDWTGNADILWLLGFYVAIFLVWFLNARRLERKTSQSPFKENDDPFSICD